jgi:dolichyl-phosphate beta-glucosyltransferase
MSAVSHSVELSIVVPAYNEEHRLAPTLARLSAHLATQPLSWEIVVVDDGSRDATCTVVEAAMARLPGLRLVRQSPNRGKGAAVRLGMRAARGQIRVSAPRRAARTPGHRDMAGERAEPRRASPDRDSPGSPARTCS